MAKAIGSEGGFWSTTGGLRGSPDRAPAARSEVDPALRQLSRWLDSVFVIPGLNLRFGLDALVGLIPGFGDTVTALLSFYILLAGVRQGVPKVTIARMGLNLAIDYLVGAIPLLGDAFDIVFKANERNVRLLEQRAAANASRRSHWSDWLFVLGILLGLALLLGAIAFAVYSLLAMLISALVS